MWNPTVETWIFLFIFLFSAREGLTSTVIHKTYPSPAVVMDYKMVIEAGKEFCTYQYVYPNSVFQVNFQVIRGGDGQAVFMVTDPQGVVVLPYEWKVKSTYETKAAIEGYYSVCVNNVYSTSYEKLVSIYMVTYEATSWAKHSAEFAEMGVDSENFAAGLDRLDQRIQYMLQYLHNTRANEARNFAVLLENNAEVTRWSIIQLLIIFASGSLYVFFIRQLFRRSVPRGGGGNFKVTF